MCRKSKPRASYLLLPKPMLSPSPKQPSVPESRQDQRGNFLPSERAFSPPEPWRDGKPRFWPFLLSDYSACSRVHPSLSSDLPQSCPVFSLRIERSLGSHLIKLTSASESAESGFSLLSRSLRLVTFAVALHQTVLPSK